MTQALYAHMNNKKIKERKKEMLLKKGDQGPFLILLKRVSLSWEKH
jgi:hypothetical protein